MLCHHIADLGQVKHLMNPVGLVMGHHLLTTAGALPGRIVVLPSVGRPQDDVHAAAPWARLGTTSFLAGSGRLRAGRVPEPSVEGAWRSYCCLVEAVFKLGDARHQLVNQPRWFAEGQRQAGWWRNGFAHDVMVPLADQAGGNSGSKGMIVSLFRQCHLGEQLPIMSLSPLTMSIYIMPKTRCASANSTSTFTDHWSTYGQDNGPNWEEILGGEFTKRSQDYNFNHIQKEMYGQFENTFMMYLPRLCEHCLNPACGWLLA